VDQQTPKKKIPHMTITRLAKYLNCLSLLPREHYREISSKELAEKIGLKPTVIRQDFHHFGGFGQAGYRYKVANLIEGLERILGLDQKQNVIIVGVGNLGQALAHYHYFDRLGLRLAGLFDVNPRLIGMTIRDVRVQDIDYIADTVQQEEVTMAIIATPAEAAQNIANLLIQSGVKAIWNFSPLNITGPPSVIIQNEHLAVGVMTLSYQLKQTQQIEDRP
jgi:redox-sensing transcriptional repressor